MKFLSYLAYNLAISFNFNLLRFIKALISYAKDVLRYVALSKSDESKIDFTKLSPYLADKTQSTEIEPIYFLQNNWLFENLVNLAPKKHVDIASEYKTIALLSKVVKTEFVDIRPPDIPVNGLKFTKGTVLDLRYKSNSLESVSSICVLEHIGLGRYGDIIDPNGTEKSIVEITRVLNRGGHLFVSVPVDTIDRACFNAHRTFTRKYFISLFYNDFYLKSEQYIYGKQIFSKYSARKGFGTGLFHFVKK